MPVRNRVPGSLQWLRSVARASAAVLGFGATFALAQGASLPPRTVSDITALLAQYKPDPARAKALRDVANAEPPADASKSALLDFHVRRAVVREALGLTQGMLADRRLAVELSAGGIEAPRHILWLGVAEQSSGNFQSAARQFESLINNRSSLPGVVRTASYLLAGLYAMAGDAERAQRLIGDGDAAYNRIMFSAFWFPYRHMYAAQRDWASGMALWREGRFAEGEVALRRAVASWEDDLKVAADRERSVLGAPPVAFIHAGHDYAELSLSQNLLALGRTAEAEISVRNVLRRTLSRVGRYSPATAAALAYFAQVLNEQGRFAEAGTMASVSLEILDALGAPASSLLRVGAQRALANSHAGREDWSRAHRMFTDLREVAETDEYNRRYVRVSADSAIAAVHSGAAAQELPRIEARLADLASALGAEHHQTGMMRGVQAMALAATGAREAALAGCRESMRVLLAPGAGSEQSESLALRRVQQRQVIEACIALLADIRGTPLEKSAGVEVIAESFRLADAARGGSVQQALAASAARSAANQPGIGALIRKEQDLRQETAALYDFLLRMMGAPPEQQLPKVIVDMRARIGAIAQERAALSQQIEKRFPDYAALVNPRPATLEEARRALRPGEALLSVYSGANRSFAWAINSRGEASFHASPLGESGIRRIVASLRATLDPGDVPLERVPAFDFRGAHRLDAELIAPAEGVLSGADRLIVSAAGALAQLPLAMLPTQAVSPARAQGAPLFSEFAQVPWLARRMAIADVPTVNALVRLRSLPAGSAQRSPFAGFGDPQFSRDAPAAPKARVSVALRSLQIARVESAVPGADGSASSAMPSEWTAYGQLTPLPDTRDEILSIARALGADAQKDVYLGREANRKKVMQTDLSKRRIVAFATHGLIPGDLPGLDQPALALAAPEDAKESPLLTLDDVLGLKLDADWVVLSACNTAAGDGQGAEAVSGLGRGFFYAGTRALLVTHWPVETVSARKLVSGIFERYAKEPTLTRAQAVQGAMLAVMADRADTFSYAHPMFWAPYALVGDGGR